MISLPDDVHVTIAGALIALLIAGSVATTLRWMLRTPASYVQRMAEQAASELQELVGSIMVVF